MRAHAKRIAGGPEPKVIACSRWHRVASPRRMPTPKKTNAISRSRASSLSQILHVKMRARRSPRSADGVTVKVLTGDSDVVTRHVCEAVGIDASEIRLGEDIARMTEGALEHVVERANVFARVSPAQKNQIVLALKKRRHVVGFLGDGINDAPSLHAADVGISVANAVDVARAAAAVILLSPASTFFTLASFKAVAHSETSRSTCSWGRAQLRKHAQHGGRDARPSILPMFRRKSSSTIFDDVSQITIPTDHVDSKYLKRPQQWDVRFIRRFMLFIGPVRSAYDFLTFYVMFHFFHASERLFHTGWFVESIATQTLVIFVIRTKAIRFAVGRASRSRDDVAIVAASCILPMTPIARWMGFGHCRGPTSCFLRSRR